MPVDPRLLAALDAPLRSDCGKGTRPGRSRGGRSKTVARGYAGTPGTGPAGETCSSCKFKTTVQGGAKSFPKCAAATQKWTRGPASDIRVKSPACQFWEAKA